MKFFLVINVCYFSIQVFKLGNRYLLYVTVSNKFVTLHRYSLPLENSDLSNNKFAVFFVNQVNPCYIEIEIHKLILQIYITRYAIIMCQQTILITIP